MEQKDMNNLSPAELKAMADALLAADDEKQAKAKTKAAPAADKTAAADKPEAEKTTEEKLNELVERGKKAGKLSSKDLMALEDMNLSSEETEKFYDRLESLGIDVLGDDALLPVDEDALPELEELEEIEEVTEEEMNETEAMADTFSTDDPVRMYLKEIGKVNLLTRRSRIWPSAWPRATRRPSAAWPRQTCVWSCRSPSATSGAACCFSTSFRRATSA